MSVEVVAESTWLEAREAYLAFPKEVRTSAARGKRTRREPRSGPSQRVTSGAWDKAKTLTQAQWHGVKV